MGFKIKKTKKQRIVGTITLLLFLLIMFCIIYFLTYFFTLASSTHEGEKIIQSDWRVIISDSWGYNAPQGVIFSFEDNGKFSIKYEDGEKIASGFYKIKVNKKEEKQSPSSGVIKLLMLPFGQNFPDEWEMSPIRSNIDFSFIYYQKDDSGSTVYVDGDYNVMSDTMEFQTTGSIFKLVREDSDDAKSVVISTKTDSSDDSKDK